MHCSSLCCDTVTVTTDTPAGHHWLWCTDPLQWRQSSCQVVMLHSYTSTWQQHRTAIANMFITRHSSLSAC